MFHKLEADINEYQVSIHYSRKEMRTELHWQIHVLFFIFIFFRVAKLWYGDMGVKGRGVAEYPHMWLFAEEVYNCMVNFLQVSSV